MRRRPQQLTGMLGHSPQPPRMLRRSLQAPRMLRRRFSLQLRREPQPLPQLVQHSMLRRLVQGRFPCRGCLGLAYMLGARSASPSVAIGLARASAATSLRSQRPPAAHSRSHSCSCHRMFRRHVQRPFLCRAAQPPMQVAASIAAHFRPRGQKEKGKPVRELRHMRT